MKALLLALSFLFLLPSCKDDDMPPPPFRCKVDGVEWTPAIPEGSQWGGNNATSFQYYDDVQFISLSVQRHLSDESINQSMTFDAEPVVLGENQIEHEKRSFMNWHNEGNCVSYDLDTSKQHIINIKVLDREKRIISGTFQFSAYDEDCNESIDITDGEFNFNF